MVTGWTPEWHHRLKYRSNPLISTKIKFQQDPFASGLTNEIAEKPVLIWKTYSHKNTFQKKPMTSQGLHLVIIIIPEYLAIFPEMLDGIPWNV